MKSGASLISQPKTYRDVPIYLVNQYRDCDGKPVFFDIKNIGSEIGILGKVNKWRCISGPGILIVKELNDQGEGVIEIKYINKESKRECIRPLNETQAAKLQRDQRGQYKLSI
jgi:hypothetical protein